jgi:molecular chaperone GrpE
MQDKENTQAESAEKDIKDKEQAQEVESKEMDQEEPQETDALTELQKKYDTLNDKYLRLYSEFENFRRRTAKEKLDGMRNAGADIVKDLLPVVDDFDRAIVSNEQINDVDSLKEGFKLIHHKLLHLLEQQGLKPMDSIGKEFDTEYHEAITNIPAPEESMKGKVVDVAEKGYFFKDKVLRYAKVIVGQ